MKAILKLKNKKLYLDWEFRYDKIPKWMHVNKSLLLEWKFKRVF